jgi:hypothetical protein
MNEAETRAEHIDPALKAAGWGVVDGSRVRREVIAPCACWKCDNLILFPDRMGIDATMEIVHSEAVDWVTWATTHGLIA